MNKNTCEVDGCDGVLSLVANNDRSLASPASHMKYQCSADSTHEFDDPRTMPKDHFRSI